MIAALMASDLLDQLGFTEGGLSISPVPLVKGLALGLLSTLLFTLWPLLTIREVKPARIFRREIVPMAPPASQNPQPWWRAWRKIDQGKGITSIGIGLGLALLSVWQAGSWRVGALFIAAFAGAVVLLGLAARALLRVLTRRPRPDLLIFRQALGNVLRPGSQAVSITIAIGIGVMVVTTVSLVERSLLAQVGENRPSDAPTFFFIDIQPDQTEEFVRLLHQRTNDPAPRLTPLVRSRLASIKGQPIKLEALSEAEEQKERSEAKKDQRKKWYLTREYVLTFLQDLPKDNRVVAGEWCKPGQTFPPPLISFEEEAATQLGFHIGDPIVVDIQGVFVLGEIEIGRANF